MKYDFTAIEKKWQTIWEETKPYAAVTGDTTRPKFYGLIEFPYPSGSGPSCRPPADRSPLWISSPSKTPHGGLQCPVPDRL